MKSCLGAKGATSYCRAEPNDPACKKEPEFQLLMEAVRTCDCTSEVLRAFTGLNQTSMDWLQTQS